MSRLDDDVRRILREPYQNKPKKIIKLPCGHMSVEIMKAEDQYVHCTKCNGLWWLLWSNVGNHKWEGYERNV